MFTFAFGVYLYHLFYTYNLFYLAASMLVLSL